MQQELTTLAVGTIIQDPAGGCYVIEGLLGTGGFGAVYLVRDQLTRDSLFALKEVIDPKIRERERFVFEGEILKRLHHRALPRVYGVFEHNKLKRVYMVMDYVEGKNLETLRREQPEQRFSLPVTMTLMAPIVDALIYLHHQDPPIVHRDIKPANIIVPRKTDETVLVDFGLAKEYTEDTTTTLIRHGSPGYAALEQYGSGTTPRTDIYGLGATFYALLTGKVPIDAVSRASESKGIDPLPPASLITPDVPTAVAKTLRRAMSISSDDRFATVREFWQELTVHVPQTLTPIPHISSLDTPYTPTLSQQVVRTPPSHKRQYAPRGGTRAVFLTILSTLLLIGVIATGFFTYMLAHRSLPATSSSSQSTATATVVSPTSTPSPSQPVYPKIALSYAGTAGDLMTKSHTDMYLTNVHQNRMQIEGFYQGLGMVGPFKGTVSTAGILLFKVTIFQGNATLSFEGTIKVAGDIVGSFKVLDQHGNFTGESGFYSVTPHQ
jgi:eukaryotic-like serine/threonine-protein kinase